MLPDALLEHVYPCLIGIVCHCLAFRQGHRTGHVVGIHPWQTAKRCVGLGNHAFYQHLEHLQHALDVLTAVVMVVEHDVHHQSTLAVDE